MGLRLIESRRRPGSAEPQDDPGSGPGAIARGLPPVEEHWAALQGRRVLVRVDLNVAHTEDSAWLKDLRVKQAVRLARRLSDLGCTTILASHYGRPYGCPLATHSMSHIAQVLSRLFDLPVRFVPSLAQAEERLRRAAPGQILLLENLRFDPGEEAGDEAFARRLAGLADCYVHEAFAASHREHASPTHLPALLPAYAGPGLARERARVRAVLAGVQSPLVVIAGGAKADKLQLFARLSWGVDTLLLGSGLAAAALRQPGLLDGFGPSVVMPEDFYVQVGRGIELLGPQELKPEMQIVDIGPRALRRYQEAVGDAQMIVCNGALGILATSDPRSSTGPIAETINRSPAFKIACGGTGTAVYNRVTYKFSGGGALLACLAEELPRREARRHAVTSQ